jgi:hypothetical protein
LDQVVKNLHRDLVVEQGSDQGGGMATKRIWKTLALTG